ncbi:MAG: D-alanine--D-alanine ligase [Gammaproteobacteria bacterium]|nr:D-alanine--D-alanine ligase [Gammaproteobacteria bacterium]MBL6999436.1 D-alanine--D-alanine ligase [Gammaproteobacteria bacterium]
MNFDHLIPAPDTPAKCGRVAVLMGGTSAERAVSLKSGSFVLQALLDAGVDAFGVDLNQDRLVQLQDLQADRVFNILHGRGGEDGEVQAILEILNLPYTGSGVKASAVTMDKLMTKRLLLGSGIHTPAFMQLKTLQDCQQALDVIGLPLIIKPVNEGSSIGMSKVTSAEELEAAFLLAAQYGAVLAEQWVSGSEYTVAWVGNTVLPAIRLETPHVFYDYSAKYEASDTRYICPCGLDPQPLQSLNEIVAQTIDVCEVRDWGRVDLMRDEQGRFQVIEVNTVPGMTDHSLVPMAAKQAGLSFQQLVLKLIHLTLREEVQHV